ncbi:MAG: M23 family metallopeptidase [Clostridiaceae bacterium]|nr:M23 family metallopeptidase [Clostridiaceae bacterium]
MKFRKDLNNRYIYFLVLLIAALLTAGGVIQYRNYLMDKQAQVEFEKNMEEYIEDSELDSLAQVIEEPGESSGNEAVEETSDATEVSKSNSVKITESKKDTQVAAKPESKPVSAVKKEESVMETMVVPVFGTTYTEFSEDVLVYSKTLDQWSTHTGIDIKAEEGSPVRAAMDGVVDRIFNDPQLGLTIVLDHGSEVYTKYSNLSTLDLVSINQSIKKGDVISGIGKTALYEIADDPHLHFEVIKQGKSVDPKKYLPKQALKK